ncbi:hypothetical protein COLO4_38372 [Corchorus olitorius]|uniref:CCT domain-containing protein n=1 Tax=Corchorus olitorius TaxID=93759 RepID=A0A1R3FVB7_9ROSI|nr:hypothetical protein COLO4_38372 [Corchorus olitorius]
MYSNYSFSNNDLSHQFPNPLLISQDNYNITSSAGATAINPCSTWGDQEISFPMFLDNAGLDVFQQDSNVPAALFPEFIGISSDMVVPSLAPDNSNVAGFCGIGTFQNFGGRYQDVCEFGDECSGFVRQDFKLPVDPTLPENWGIQGNRMQPAMEDSNLKVGRYSVEERKDRILRYLKKRNQRNFNKTIKYACRKTLADRRVRVRGRFARNTELSEEEMVMKKEDDNSPNDDKCCWDSVQIKQDDDEWLQEAMANLMYLPYISGN